eukprot:gnl/TRDRNA2_/TRDRNA2_195257_c0_seq1.p3 gnl/TRDRNA2_/TRDRNA2_195257_c0~~gnl/TRDRNA2_/TRDRNA2_195257_c0_seq1.p3  ORF type:complete len:119 (+),score=24.52 gnl/TRDRNA2_/TRDRNA2_195257_c0_seq1:100-456(+)
MPWETGLCSCCAEPGGVGLCLRTCCCPCTVVGDINVHVGGPGGFMGGCCGTCCGLAPCCMAFNAPQVAQKSGFDESGIKACCCACCPCTECCYLAQVARECQIQQAKGIGKPMQMEMN